MKIVVSSLFVLASLGGSLSAQAQDANPGVIIRNCSHMVDRNVDSAAETTAPESIEFFISKNDFGKYSFKSSFNRVTNWCPDDGRTNCNQKENDHEIKTYLQRRTKGVDGIGMWDFITETAYDKISKKIRITQFRHGFTTSRTLDIVLQCE